MPKALEAVTALKAKWAGANDRASVDHPALNVPATDSFGALKALRDEFGFDMLTDISGLDASPSVTPRFSVIYHVFSTSTHEYVRIAVACHNDTAPEVPSVVALWPGAGWHEREAFDMFGIRFPGNPDLRRILMWDGYPHYPLRKDFPLAGIETELPDPEVVAETKASVTPAPMMGGPFVASSGKVNLTEAEPRAKDESWTERQPKPDA